jgi:1,4-dihydroxy-2-naphthoate octaprenyltransferase
MESLKYKIKISVLWISFAICASAAMIIWFIEPGILEQIMTTGEMVREKLTQENIIFCSLWWLIPLTMSLLTQILNYLLNRWLNIVLGVICALVSIYYIISNMLTGWFRMANFLILIFMLIATVLITYYAWIVPKEEV